MRSSTSFFSTTPLGNAVYRTDQCDVITIKQHLEIAAIWQHIIKNKFNTKNRGAPKSAGPVAIATFSTIVNPALATTSLLHLGGINLWLRGVVTIFAQRFNICSPKIGRTTAPFVTSW